MTEVSAKFEHEAVVDEALFTLYQEWQHLWEANDRAAEDTDNAKTDKAYAALMAVEERIENTPARSVEEVAAKLWVAKRWIDIDHHNGISDLGRMPRKERLTLSALADLERLAGEAPPIGYASAIEDPVLVLGQQWENVMVERGQLKNRDDKDPQHPDVVEDGRLHDVQLNIEAEIARGPTHTAAGVVAKLLQLQRNETEFDGDAYWRPAAFRTALEALACIEG